MFFKRKQIIASLILSLFFNFNIFNNFNDNYKVTLLEVKNDGNTYMYNQYSFYIELGCDVTNVAYKGWIWQQNKKLIGSNKYHYGC